jgi:hypothetical protein
MIAETVLHAHQALILAATPPAVVNPVVVPDPGPIVIQPLQATMNTILGWGKWLAIIFGVGGLMACGVMMMVGRRNRHSFAADGAAGIPWVLGGLALVSISSGIVGVFL